MVKKEGMQLGDILTVVLTHDAALLKKQLPHTIFADKSPKDVLAMLVEKGYKEALLCGAGVRPKVLSQKSGSWKLATAAMAVR